MKTDRETLQLMAVWLEDGRTQLPDHVLDTVLEQLPSKPQRRRWSARRISSVNPIAKLAIAAAAVVVVAVVGYNLLGPTATSQFGGVASPSAEPSSGPAPLAPETSEIIDAGRYRWSSPSVDVTFDLPDGWTGREGEPGSIYKNEDTPRAFDLNFTTARYEDISVFGNPCTLAEEPVPIGESVDNLVAALDDQESTDAVVGEITAGSVTGKRIGLRQAPGLDRSQCVDGLDGPFPIWVNGAGNDFVAGGAHRVIYVFDVNGTRLVFSGGFGADAPEAAIDEVDAIVESFEFTPK